MGRRHVKDPVCHPSTGRPHLHPPNVVSQAIRLSLLNWDVKDIAKETGVSKSTIYEWQSNLQLFGSVRKPQTRPSGRPSKISRADEDALADELRGCGWMFQDEIARWFDEARGVRVDQSTVSRLVRRKGWTGKDFPGPEGLLADPQCVYHLRFPKDRKRHEQRRPKT